MTSYYRRGWYPYRRRFYSKSRSRVVTDTTTPYGKSLQFVRTEFLRLDPFAFERFSDLYARKYGDGSNQYMRRTYQSWRSGTTKMAGQTERRILECVPPVLSKEKQFKLLSFQISSVLYQQKSALTDSLSKTSERGTTDPFPDLTRIFSNPSGIKTSELESTYKSLAAIVVGHEYKLDWFVNEAFPPTEVKEFLNVFKFTMLDCLRQSYAQVRQDLMLMHEYLPSLDGSVDLSYKIALLDYNVELDIYPPPGASKLAIAMSEPTLVTQFRDQYRAILLNHAMVQCKADAISHANRQVAMTDVKNVVTQLQRTESDQEYDTTLEVEGHGGILNIRLQKKNLLRLRYEIAQQTLLFLLAVAVTGVVVVWICIKAAWLLLIFIGIPFSIIRFFWRKLHKLQLEVKDYERKRATRFTAS